MRDTYLSDFDRSNEQPLKKRQEGAKETGLKYFRERAKGSMNLRREYESVLQACVMTSIALTNHGQGHGG